MRLAVKTIFVGHLPCHDFGWLFAMWMFLTTGAASSSREARACMPVRLHQSAAACIRRQACAVSAAGGAAMSAALKIHRITHLLYRAGLQQTARAISRVSQVVFGAVLPPEAIIGDGTE